MDNVQSIFKHADTLYKMAYRKTNDIHDAEDLVQETLLSTLITLKKGNEIENIKAYLIKVLKSKFCDLVRGKNKDIVINRLENLNLFIDSDDLDFGQMNQKSPKEDVKVLLRRELANLPKIYRDVIVQYYIDGKPVGKIATSLELSKGTVLSRLDMGRKMIREGFEKNDMIADNSYKPDRLSIICKGIPGLNKEPLSVVTNLIEENILILAYSKPQTIREIAVKMGLTSVFIEELVDKMYKNELMSKRMNKYYTNFLIIRDDQINEKQTIKEEFINANFSKVKSTITDLVKAYSNSNILSKYNEVQLYSYGMLSVFQLVLNFISEELNLLKLEDYPKRPNGGKWVIHAGYLIKDKRTWANLPPLFYNSDFSTNQPNELVIEEWNTNIGTTFWLGNNVSMPPGEKARHLFRLHKEKDILLDHEINYLIPKLVELGYLKNDENDKLSVNIPIISANDYETLKEINSLYANKLINVIGEELITMLKQNQIECPKDINPVSPCSKLICFDGLSLIYVKKAAKEGMITIDSNRNYPISMIIAR